MSVAATPRLAPRVRCISREGEWLALLEKQQADVHALYAELMYSFFALSERLKCGRLSRPSV